MTVGSFPSYAAFGGGGAIGFAAAPTSNDRWTSPCDARGARKHGPTRRLQWPNGDREAGRHVPLRADRIVLSGPLHRVRTPLHRLLHRGSTSVARVAENCIPTIVLLEAGPALPRSARRAL